MGWEKANDIQPESNRNTTFGCRRTLTQRVFKKRSDSSGHSVGPHGTTKTSVRTADSHTEKQKEPFWTDRKRNIQLFCDQEKCYSRPVCHP